MTKIIIENMVIENEDREIIENSEYSDLQELQLHQRRSPGWWATIVNFVGVATLTIVILISGCYLVYRARVYYVKQKSNESDSDTPEEEAQPALHPHLYPHVPHVIQDRIDRFKTVLTDHNHS
jgi:hypothetical protein